MTNQEWVDWFFSMDRHDQETSLGDMGEQVDLLHRVRTLLQNCEEYGDDIDFEDVKKAAWGE